MTSRPRTAADRGREKVKPGIYRRRDAKRAWLYEIVYRDSTGVQRRQRIIGGRREAETALHDVKSRMGRGEKVAPSPNLTFAVAAEQWLVAKSPNLTEKTIASYRYALDSHLLPTFGRIRLDKLDVTAVSAFVARMATAEYRQEIQVRNGQRATATAGYSVATIKSSLIPLSRTMAYAKRNLGFAGENAVAALDLDERPGYRHHKPTPRTLGREEIAQALEHSRSPWSAVIATAAALGTRLGETLGIEWRHVDFEAGLIRIEQQSNAKRQIARLKTEKSCRTIEAPDFLLSMLRTHKVRSPHSADDDLVFTTATGKPHSHGNVLARGLYPALDRAGLPRVSFHSLRHSHASLWIKDGGDVITLSKRLGHSTPQITMTTYAHAIEEAADNAIRKARVNAMFDGTRVAAAVAAHHDHGDQQTAPGGGADVVILPAVGA